EVGQKTGDRFAFTNRHLEHAHTGEGQIITARHGGQRSAANWSRTVVVSAPTATPRLSSDDLDLINAFWRAANYLSVGQIYLLDNPLVREPISEAHIKPRLLGHWGTTPGLNLIYAHLNRIIRARDLDVIYIAGPGHGGPAMVANAYLEGTYSEVYTGIGQDSD